MLPDGVPALEKNVLIGISFYTRQKQLNQNFNKMLSNSIDFVFITFFYK